MGFIFGGKGWLDIGMGKRVVKIGGIGLRRIYFMDCFWG